MFIKFIKEIDFYGINFPLLYKNKPNLSTKLGLKLSILTLILSLIFSIIYILDMINRKSFKIYSYI